MLRPRGCFGSTLNVKKFCLPDIFDVLESVLSPLLFFCCLEAVFPFSSSEDAGGDGGFAGGFAGDLVDEGGLDVAFFVSSLGGDAPDLVSVEVLLSDTSVRTKLSNESFFDLIMPRTSSRV